MNAKRNCFGYLLPSVCEAIEQLGTEGLIVLALENTFRCIGIDDSAARGLIHAVIGELHRSKSVDEVERRLHSVCAGVIASSVLRSSLDVRARVVAQQIRPHLRGKRIADIGCGDGMVMHFVGDAGYEVQLADVIYYVDARAKFPFTLLCDPKLKDIEGAFDTVLLLTVLHHAPQPEDLLDGLAAIAAKRIIVIESVVEVPPATSPIARLLGEQEFEVRFGFAVFADWFYNRILHEDVLVPYNFGTVADWHAAFGRHGYYPVVSENLGIDQPLVPEVHQLLVYDLG